MSNIPNEEVHTEESTRQFLLSDESYALLNNAKQKIKNETEVSPTLRKMINDLITSENVEKLTNELIRKLS